MKTFKEFVAEGNKNQQVLRAQREGYHHVIISGAQDGASPEDKKKQNAALHKEYTDAGFVSKKTMGVWNNPDTGKPEEEPSGMYKAKKPGREGAAELLSFTKKMQKKYKQKAFIHHTPEGKGIAHNSDGSKDTYGKRVANKDNPYGETQFNPSKPKKLRQKFTYAEE